MQLRVSKLFISSHSSYRTRGDTIIEVLLCIAIVGAVIAGAYALASRSLMQGISASERTEAVKLAEGQVEALKFRQRSTANVWADNFIDPNMNFCLDTSVTSQIKGDGSLNPDWRPQNNAGNVDDLRTVAGTYNTKCVVNNKYFISITTPAAASTNPTYLVTVKWVPPGVSYDPSDTSTYGRLNKSQLYYRF